VTSLAGCGPLWATWRSPALHFGGKWVILSDRQRVELAGKLDRRVVPGGGAVMPFIHSFYRLNRSTAEEPLTVLAV